MRPGEAVMELFRLGFRFRLEGEAVKVRYVGPENPDTDQVTPLLEVVKENKEEVRHYLTDARIYSSNKPERILTCRECPWHQANPWSHYPDLPNWCGYHMDHLLKNNPACIGWRRGEIPGRREGRKP